MLATPFQPPLISLDEIIQQGRAASDMSLEEIQAELCNIAPHIGRTQQAIAAQQNNLENLETRARELVNAAKSKTNTAYHAPQGFSLEKKIDVHVVGGPTYIEHMLRDWRNLVVDALEINPDKLREKILSLITEKNGHLQFIDGINLPILPRHIETLNFDYEQLAALPLPPKPSIVIQTEPVDDPLEEPLGKP